MQGLNNLLGGMLQRHGIAKQVTSTMIVQKANDLLSTLAQPPLVYDICATVFADGELIISCRHSMATYDLQPLLPQLRAELERSFPDRTFAKIRTRISPAEWYNRDGL